MVAPLLAVCGAEFALDQATRGNAGSSAETVSEAASYCVERPKEFSDSATTGEVGSGAGLSLVVAPLLTVCGAVFALDRATRGKAGSSPETVGEATSDRIERPKEFSVCVTAGEVDNGAGLSLVVAPLLTDCGVEFAFDHGTRGNAGSSAETVGEATPDCIARRLEIFGCETAGEADGGTGLWLVAAASLPVCVARFAFDHRTPGNAGSSAGAVGEAASPCIERPKELSDSVTAGIRTTICCATV